MPNFHMDAFLEELNGRRNELDGDIFEMLYTLSGDPAVIYLFLEMGDPPSLGPVPMGPIPISLKLPLFSPLSVHMDVF